MSLPTNFFIGRGKMALSPGIVSTDLTSTGFGGRTFFLANNPHSTIGNQFYNINTQPGGVFYLGLVGASGAGGYRTGHNGFGGSGLVEVKVPAGVTSLKLGIGGGGQYVSNSGSAQGGTYEGGNGGSSGGTYNASSGGGGLVSLYTGGYIVPSISTIIAMVGSGGGTGAGSNDFAGCGGGFNLAGSDGTANNGLADTRCGSGGTLTAGGAAATAQRGYTSNNMRDGELFRGGKGSDSTYDGGAGGGAGYYGGGGGAGGGGYDGGCGGGGSGYAHPTHCTVIHTTTTVNDDYNTNFVYPVGFLNGAIQQHTGISSFAIGNNNYGGLTNQRTSGFAGTAVIYNPV